MCSSDLVQRQGERQEGRGVDRGSRVTHPGRGGLHGVSVVLRRGRGGDKSAVEATQDTRGDTGRDGVEGNVGQSGAGAQTAAGPAPGDHTVVVDLTVSEEDSETLVTGRPG